MSQLAKIVLLIARPGISLLLSFVLGGMFIFFIGKDPLLIYSKLFTETLGNWYGVGQVLFKTTTFIFTGLAAAIAFRTGLFNIGAEGQLIIGAFVTAVVGFTFIGLPAFLLLPCCLIAGMFGGAVWGGIPGLLKARFGSHEVINTIMMNFIAAALVSYFVNSVFAVPATIHTSSIAPAAQLPRLGSFWDDMRASPVNVSFFIALIACLVTYYFLWMTPSGYELRATGLNARAAEYGGINVQSRTTLAMALSGAVAGLGGINFVLGYKHYYEIGFSEGAGFIGIAVALLGKNHPFGIILAALFFGILEYGGLTINALVPKELVNILQAMTILIIIISGKVFDSWMFKYQKRISLIEQHA
jgi:simple sugar transport system permease protein